MKFGSVLVLIFLVQYDKKFGPVSIFSGSGSILVLVLQFQKYRIRPEIYVRF